MVGISCILLIGFTAVQLWNYKVSMDRFNIYKIKRTILYLKSSFQDAVTVDKDVGEAIKEKAKLYIGEGIVENIGIINKDKEVIFKDGDISFEDDDFELVDDLFFSGEDTSYRTSRGRLDYFFRLGDYVVKVTFPLLSFFQIFHEAILPVVWVAIIVIIVNSIVAIWVSNTLITPISNLYRVTKEVAAGDLNKKIIIRTGDELELLANNFNYMIDSLRKMKVRAERANPLTGLSGNIIIREEVEKRLANREKFFVVYIDLDNFKAFNDKYGVERGDQAIKLTASILKEAVEKYGIKGDFVGHEGGDDFILVLSPSKVNDVVNHIINEFDRRVKDLYDEEDRKKGYIEARARFTNDILKFPLMTISLVGVTNVHREIKNYAQVTNIAAEVKKKAKKYNKSVFIVDQRKT